VLELGKVLAARGHIADFATLESQSDWAKKNTDISGSPGAALPLPLGPSQLLYK
jgi:hypothetical protein